MSDRPLAISRTVYSWVRADAFTVDGYPSLWSANLAWNIARWMEVVAVGWIALELTHSAFLVALVGFYRSLPLFVLGAFGGVLGDRYNRRRLMLALQAVNVGAIGALAALDFAGQLSYWHVVVAEAVVGVSMAFDWPSRRSLTIDLVGRGRLTNAVAFDATAMNISRTLGPLVSGLVIEESSTAMALLILAGLYLANGFLIAHVRLPASTSVAKVRGVWHNLRDGAEQVLRDEAIVGVLAITVVMNLLFFPYQQLLPVVAADVLGVGSIGLGALAASDGLGSLLGTILIAMFANHRRNGFYFWVGSIVGGLALVGFSFARALDAAVVLLFVGGFFRASFSAFQAAIILRKSSDVVRGRAMGLLTIAIGVGPFGALEIGAVAQALGTPTAILGNAMICVVLVALVGARLRRLREA